MKFPITISLILISSLSMAQSNKLKSTHGFLNITNNSIFADSIEPIAEWDGHWNLVHMDTVKFVKYMPTFLKMKARVDSINNSNLQLLGAILSYVTTSGKITNMKKFTQAVNAYKKSYSK